MILSRPFVYLGSASAGAGPPEFGLDLIIKTDMMAYVIFWKGNFLNMQLEKFERLGQKLESLLGRVDELNRRRDELTRTLAAKDEEIKELQDKLAVFEQERSLVKAKVDELLERIDAYAIE